MGSNPITSCLGFKQKPNHQENQKSRNNKHKSKNKEIVQDSIESIEDYGIEIEDKYRGSLAYIKASDLIAKGGANIEVKDSKYFYKRRKNLIFTNRIVTVSQNLNLSEQNILHIWKFFKHLDPKSIGYITLDQIYILIKEYIGTDIISES